jgi:serine protease Do
MRMKRLLVAFPVVALLCFVAMHSLSCKSHKGSSLFGGQEESPLKNSSDVETAWEIQNTFRKIYDLYKDRVVFISTEQQIKLPYDPFYEMFGGGEPRVEKQTGLGSGFIISEDGYICTNFHVVGPHGSLVDKITVIIDNDSYKAEVKGYDPKMDIALLKIQPKKKLLPVFLGNSDEVKVGDWAIAIGNPFGLSKSFTVGVVSATGRKDVSNDREAYIQTDAAINPGNSGGTLINIRGEVIGINRMIYSQSGGYMGIGFAIPINRAKATLEALIQGKTPKQLYIGIKLERMNPDIARQLDWGYDFGVVVSATQQGGPAAAAGIKRGDIIYALNGNDIHDPEDFGSAIEYLNPGDAIELMGWRQGVKIRFVLKIGSK